MLFRSYLAAGLPVVSSDNPAVRWLDTDLIRVTAGPADFVAAVSFTLAHPGGPADERTRREFAGHHSWDARAAQLRTMVSALSPARAPLPR